MLFFEETLDYGPGLAVLLVMHALFPLHATSNGEGGRTPCSEWKKSGMQFLRRPSERVRLRSLRFGFLRWPWWLLHRWVNGDVIAGRADVRAVVVDGETANGGWSGCQDAMWACVSATASPGLACSTPI